MSDLRLNWAAPPEIVGTFDLEAAAPGGSSSVLAVAGRGVDGILFVNRGSSVVAVGADGTPLWETAGLGTGDLLDAIDLDIDGIPELLFTSFLSANPHSASGPGTLHVLDATSGLVLWSHRFSGLEFGLSRYRTTVATVDGGRSLSIFGVMTYSPSLWRIDYSRALGGRVTWRSEPFVYDSPDAAPVVQDVDGDGAPEVLVDSLGHLYAVDAGTGRVEKTLPYADHPTFGGTIGVWDTGSARLIVDMSSSAYGGVAAAFRVEAAGEWTRLWQRTWSAGLGQQADDVMMARALVTLGGRPFALWSHGPPGQSDEHVLEAVAVDTGAVAFALTGARLEGVIASPSGRAFVASSHEGRVSVHEFHAGGFESRMVIEGGQWWDFARFRPPSASSVNPLPDAGLVRREGGGVVLVTADPDGLQMTALPSGDLSAGTPLHALPGGALLVSDGKSILAIDRASVRAVTTHRPPVFGVPLAGEFDGDPSRELVVPYRRGLGRLDFSSRRTMSVVAIGTDSVAPRREGLFVPTIVQGNTPAGSVIVAYEWSAGAVQLVGRDVVGGELWRRSLNPFAWEFILAPQPAAAAGDPGSVFLRESLGSHRLDARTGNTLWHVDFIGECQRQTAIIDWDGDGHGDLAMQAGAEAIVLDGISGRQLFRQTLGSAYGAYTAAGPGPALAMTNAGGLALLNLLGVEEPPLGDPRRQEAIPPVVGAFDVQRADHVFTANGSGVLSVFSLDGDLLARRATGLSVRTMTGAYIDADETLDMLVSTFEGELAAVSGKSLTELWRVRLGAAGGPAIVTDVDGDGDGEIAVITSDGRLLLVAVREPASDNPGLPAAGDADGDTISNEDEWRFGLDPLAEDDDLDSDGDAVTNADEIAAGTHPRGLWTAYLPGGVESAFFDTRIALANPSATHTARTLLRLADARGRHARIYVLLPPHTRRTIDIGDELPGFEAAEFGVAVEADRPIAVDGTQSWGTPRYGAAAERGITTGASTVWYLAEGATHSGFELYYMFQNDTNRAAVVEVMFLRPAGLPPVRWTGVVGAGTRFTLPVNAVGGLEATDVSGVVRSANGVPILVERSMFLGRPGFALLAGHQASAIRAPATKWVIAEGATGPYFDTFVLVANPSQRPTVVEVTYLLPSNGTVVKRYPVAALSRLSIWVDTQDPRLASTAVSAVVESTDGVGVVVERAMWWPGTSWHEAHASAGETDPAPRWCFAEGEVGGPSRTETYILVANTIDAPGRVAVTVLFEDGTSASRGFDLLPLSRTNIAIASEFPSSADRRFGVLVESLGERPVPIVAERAVYADGGGVRWASGTAASGTRLP